MKKSAALLYSTQVPLKASALGEVVNVAAWRSKPSWYVLSRDDRMLSPQLQAPPPSASVHSCNRSAAAMCRCFRIRRRWPTASWKRRE